MGAQARIGGPGAAASDLTVDLLGPVRVRRGDRTIDLAPSQRRLAAALAVHGDEGATSGWLSAATGAPDPDSEAAGRSLRTAVWRLRSKVGEEALVAERGRYRLVLGPDDVDLARFLHLSEQGRLALEGGQPEPARSRLREALGLWRGPMLADSPIELPLPPIAAGAEALRRDVVELVAEASLATGAAAEVVDELAAVVDEHPTRERAWALLIEAHLALGNVGAARDAARRAGAALAEVGLVPSAALREVIERVEGSGEAAPAPAALAPWLAAARQDGPLVGRRDQLAAVRSRLVRCAGADGPSLATLVLVAGEPGIGKTRLVAEVAEAARLDGWRIWADRVDQLDPSPYQGVAALLEGLLADAPAEVATTARRGPLRHLIDVDVPGSQRDEAALADDRQLLFGAVAELAAAAVPDRPTLAVIDDLHGCDRDSVLLLCRLLQSRPDLPLTVLGTVRRTDEGVLADPAVHASLPADTLWAVLDGLTPGEVADLAGDAGGEPGRAARLHALSGGNPLFVRHVLAAGAAGDDDLDGAGPGLAQAVERHLASLHPDTRAVLEEAAVQGRRFRLDLLVETEPTAVAAAIDDAERTHLVRPDGGGAFAFQHSVVQQVLEAGQPGATKAARHLALARMLEAESPSGAGGLLTVARHHRGAAPLGGAGPAVRYATAAAEQAEQALDAELAARAWVLAASSAAPAEATVLHLRAAVADVVSGRTTAAEAELRTAAELAEASGDPGLRTAVALADADVALRSSSTLPERTRALLGRALVETEPGPRRAELAMLHALDRGSDASAAAGLRATAPDPETTADLAERAYWMADDADRGDLAALLAALLPELDRDRRAAATVALWTEEVTAGRGTLRDAPRGGYDPDVEGLAESAYGGWSWWSWAGTRAQAAGRFAEAAELAHRAHAAAFRPGATGPSYRGPASVMLATQLAATRALTEPLPPPTDVPDPANPSWTLNLGLARAGAVARAVIIGNHDLARRRLREAAELLDDPATRTDGSLGIQAATLLYQAMILGELDLVDPLAEHLRRRSGQHLPGRATYYYGAADLAVGLADLRLDRADAAVGPIERSLDQHRHVGSPVYEAHSLGALAGALERRGRPGDRSRWEAARADSDRLAAELGLSLRSLVFLHEG